MKAKKGLFWPYRNEDCLLFLCLNFEEKPVLLHQAKFNHNCGLGKNVIFFFNGGGGGGVSSIALQHNETISVFSVF